MRRTVHVGLTTLVIGAAALAGCGGSTRPTGPNAGAVGQEAADDMAIQAVLSLGVAGADLGAAIGSTPQAPQSAPRTAAPARLARPLSASRALWDTTFTQGGFTFEASRTFYDALDNALPDWSLLAVRVQWTSRAFGTASTANDTTTLGHAGVLDVRGIQIGQDTLRVDGACNDTLQNVFHSLDGLRKRYGSWKSGANLANIRILKSQVSGGNPPIPIAGTATFTVSVDRLRSNNVLDVEAHYEASVVITFDGTTSPLVVVNGLYRYHWSLITGAITRA